MNIKGADGLTPELIRDEVARGGRLVIYAYCVSVIFMTFKRPTSIYFVRAGQSPVTRGLPFALVTFLFGWWGFPWGPIYSIECLYKTLRGGIDVTDEVLATLLPLPPPVPGSTAAPQSFAPRPPAKKLSRLQILTGVSAVLAVVTLIYSAVCAHAGGTLEVAVINGLPTRATYTLNDKNLSLAPDSYQLLTLPEGEFTIGATATRSAQSFRLETPFWSRPFQRRLAVINPDRAALFYRYHVIYKGDRATGDNHGQPTDTTLYANQTHYLLDAPDYAFVEAPKSVSMPSGAGFTSKSRIALVPSNDPSERIQVVAQSLGEEAAQTYARTVARNQPDDELALGAALQTLTPEAALALLESHLDDRPLSVEWHRAYQNLSGHLHPGVDLGTRYITLAAADPAEGAFHYLAGRLASDPADARRHYDLSLAAARPCPYAHLGLGYLDAVNGRFTEALAHYDQAIQFNLKNESIRSSRRDMLFALRHYKDLLADIRGRRKAAPADLSLAAEEIHCVIASTRDASAARNIAETALTRAGADATPEDRKNMRAYLDSTLAYALGDEPGFVLAAAPLQGSRYAFQTAVCRRDHQAARLAVKEVPQLPADYLLTLHLVALQSGDADAAQTYWTEAADALHREGGTRQLAADQLAGRTPLDPAWLRTASMTATQKSLVFTSLGLRDPAKRATYHQWAAEFNFRPDFPSLLIKSALQPAPATTL